jgi:hypothetical protein
VAGNRFHLVSEAVGDNNFEGGGCEVEVWTQGRGTLCSRIQIRSGCGSGRIHL